MAATASDARQATERNGQVLAVLATELQQLTTLFTTSAAPQASSSSQAPAPTALRPAMLLSPGLGFLNAMMATQRLVAPS